MVTKKYDNIRYATNLKKNLNILIPREIRCCYFIAFENFSHDFYLLVGSSVSVLTGYPWTEGLLVYGRWCPLANTGSTESTLFRGTTPITCITPVLFLNIFFVRDVYEKIKVGLRWPEPIYLRVGYVFWIGFFGRNDLTDFSDFCILNKEWLNFKKMLFIFL